MARKRIVQKDFKGDSRLDSSGLEYLGELIIEEIISRTGRGIDKDGKRFPGYSEAYKNSLDFKIAGKSKSKVDLELSGDMLGSLEVIKIEAPFVTIGFDPGDEAADKAEGNIIGSYGKSSGSPAKARNFLGLPPKVMERLNAQAVADTTVEEVSRQEDFVNSFLDGFLRRRNGE